MAGTSNKTVAHVWNPGHVQLILLPFNLLANIIQFITNDDLRQIIENHPKISLVMKGIWLAGQLNCCGISCTCLGFQTWHNFNSLTSHMPFITNDIWRWFSVVCLRSSLVMNGIWLASQFNCSGMSYICLESQTYSTADPWHFQDSHYCKKGRDSDNAVDTAVDNDWQYFERHRKPALGTINASAVP